MVQLQPLDDADREFVHGTVASHAVLTGSPVAQRILDGWDTEAGELQAGDAGRLSNGCSR